MPIIEGGEIDYDPLRGGEDEDEETPLINKSDRVLEKEKKFDPYGGKARQKITTESLEKRLYDLKYYDPDEISLPSKLNNINREEFKDKYYPKMNDSIEIGQTENGGLACRLFGETKWTPLFTKKGKLYKKMGKELKNALGPNRDEIIKKNDEKIESKTKRIEELELQKIRTDISEEVRDTITNEINENEEEIEELNEENTAIKSKMSYRERIKEIFQKHGFTAFSILTSVGTVIGVIVSNLSSVTTNAAKGVTASVTKAIGNGVKAIGKGLKDVGNSVKENGKKIAKILPGIVGAIVSFFFRTAGDVLGFLAKNAWLLILLAVTYVIEQYSKESKKNKES